MRRAAGFGAIRMPRDGKQCTRIAMQGNSNSGGNAPEPEKPRSPARIAVRNAQALCCAAYYF
jgi:hypothetical protein